MKFKVGDAIVHKSGYNVWISGIVIQILNHRYTVKRHDNGTTSIVDIDFFDRQWVLDENKTVDLILKKYE